LGNIGLIFRVKGDLYNALKYLNNALSKYKEIGYEQGKAYSLANIGQIYNMKEDKENAKKYFIESRDLFLKIGLTHMADKIQRWIDEIDMN